MGRRTACEAIGVSRKAVAAWRRDEPPITTTDVAVDPLGGVPGLSVEPESKALVPVEVTLSPVQLGTGLSLVTPRGYRVEGLSVEQAFALLREFE